MATEKVHIEVKGGCVVRVWYESMPDIDLIQNDEVVIHDRDSEAVGEAPPS